MNELDEIFLGSGGLEGDHIELLVLLEVVDLWEGEYLDVGDLGGIVDRTCTSLNWVSTLPKRTPLVAFIFLTAFS